MKRQCCQHCTLTVALAFMVGRFVGSWIGGRIPAEIMLLVCSAEVY